MNRKFLVFDISNLLYRTFFVQKNEDDTTIAGLATHMAFTTLNKYFRQYRPTDVVMAFDRPSWRKEYTASEACISKRPYKGNRRQDMTPAQAEKYQRFINHLGEFEKLIINHTSIITLCEDRLEADDLIAGFVQRHPDDEIILISSDTDMMQLMKHKNLTLISPDTDKPRTLEEFENDAEYYVFHKCIRGDSTDNVQSALPRVQTKKILAAWNDPYERVKLMKSTWTDQEGREMVVEKLFEENKILINLECQPPEIRTAIESALEREMTTHKQFSMFHFLKFIGKYQLNKIKESIDQYIPMLSK